MTLTWMRLQLPTYISKIILVTCCNIRQQHEIIPILQICAILNVLSSWKTKLILGQILLPYPSLNKLWRLVTAAWMLCTIGNSFFAMCLSVCRVHCFRHTANNIFTMKRRHTTKSLFAMCPKKYTQQRTFAVWCPRPNTQQRLRFFVSFVKHTVNIWGPAMGLVSKQRSIVFAMCLTIIHGKYLVCRVSNSGAWHISSFVVCLLVCLVYFGKHVGKITSKAYFEALSYKVV